MERNTHQLMKKNKGLQNSSKNWKIQQIIPPDQQTNNPRELLQGRAQWTRAWIDQIWTVMRGRRSAFQTILN